MACGGTNKNGRIELQGNHVQGVAEELKDRGFDVTVDT
jgi:translation initiation factor 1 (eIF-1/SUI1)